MALVLRSVVFNVLFYLNTLIFLIIGLPTFVMPYQAIVEVAKTWGRVNLFLLRVVAGVKFELRGRDKIPPGALIVASKHQSAWDTFALIPVFRDPAMVMKAELGLIPLYGWFSHKFQHIFVRRESGPSALRAMIRDARDRAGAPEGRTRRA